jgi:sialate O-acetylesterase
MKHSRSTRLWVFLTLAALCACLIIVMASCNNDGMSTDTTAAATTDGDTTAAPVETDTPTEPDSTAADTPESTEPEETDPESETVFVPVTEYPDAEPAAAFTVSNVFSDHMVLQREEYIRVWGWAPESENGKKVCGDFADQRSEALITDGAWEMVFPTPLSANTQGQAMRIYAGECEVTFTDVLIGDVYMAIGQSNMAYTVVEHLNTTGNDPERGGQASWNYDAPIRLHYNSHLQESDAYPPVGSPEVCREIVSNSRWEALSSSDIGRFSALGYYFATELVKKTGGSVPIGIIEVEASGRPLGSFMSNEAAEASGSDRWNETLGIYETDGLFGGARFMYNRYMYPFERYPLAGVLWYQGESDYMNGAAQIYNEKFTALMTFMRSSHNLINKDFPVYVMEFPTMYTQPAEFEGQWAYMDIGLIRAIMGTLPQTLENCYVCPSSDVWADDTYWNNLHPNCKFEQADRLSSMAAYVGYGIGDASVLGPVLVSAEFSADRKTAVLTFANVGDGLTTADGGTTVRGFAAARENFGLSHNDDFEVTITAKNQITVVSEKKLGGLVYNNKTTNFFGDQINLCNSEGVPAHAFFVFPEE